VLNPAYWRQKENLAAKACHDPYPHSAGADAEPVPELEFKQTLGW